MATVINRTLGENRGKRRIWLEGVKLHREGLRPGMRYDIERVGQALVLRVRDEGRYTVSRRQRRNNAEVLPLIEVLSDDLPDTFLVGSLLRISIHGNRIVVTVHHSERAVAERESRLLEKLASGERLSVSSFFHGGGVLDKAIHAGLNRAGISSKVDLAVEIEGRTLDASLANNPELWSEESVVVESPIQFVRIKDNAPSADVVVAGIPCTGASKSGRAKNRLAFAESHESAGSLFFSFLKFVEALNPAMVILENVTAYANTASMEVIRSVLGYLGYDVQERTLDGNDFGALEKRERLCAVAVSRGLAGHFNLDEVEPIRQKEACIKDILEPVALDSERWKAFEYLDVKAKRDAAKGNNFKRQLLTGDESFCGTIGAGYAKGRSTEPFLKHPVDPSLSRIFTPVEHCRLKGIPEAVIEGLSDTVAHQVLGQSVIFPAFEAVATYLGKKLYEWLFCAGFGLLPETEMAA